MLGKGTQLRTLRSKRSKLELGRTRMTFHFQLKLLLFSQPPPLTTKYRLSLTGLENKMFSFYIAM